jgi:monoamine oxidase
MAQIASPVSRRSLLKLIGTVAGSAVMYDTMLAMGYAAQSDFSGPVKLSGDIKGASVLVLGAGIAGMTSAYELRKAGYKVQVLEYNNRPGGRNWSLYGGDTYTELGGATQQVKFDKGLYFNPGPWRIPFHHQGLLHYCRQLNVPLEVFTQSNDNAYVHSTGAFDGKPQRIGAVAADVDGYVAELLAKANSQSKLDGALTGDEKNALLQILRSWGALDKNYEYKKSDAGSARRGFDVYPGGGLSPRQVPSEPLPMQQLFKSGLWRAARSGGSPLFQPVGGMGVIGKTFGKALDGFIKYNCKVINIRQDDKGVTATYIDSKKGGAPQTARADWCVCTIPATILGQIPMNVGAPMRNAIFSLSYTASVKVGLQFKRRFWEDDEQIYGGISHTDLPISTIGYPSTGYMKGGPGVLLGAYVVGKDVNSFGLETLPAADMVKVAVDQGSRIHPQYRQEFQNGVAVAWHRVPWTLGCAAEWTEENRAKNYDNICALDGRIVLAGEHCSFITGWQEGSVLSALDSVTRLHKRVVSA